MLQINPEVLPYDSLAHWPPMTYRNNLSPSPEATAAFTEHLNTENNLTGPRNFSLGFLSVMEDVLFVIFQLIVKNKSTTHISKH